MMRKMMTIVLSTASAGWKWWLVVHLCTRQVKTNIERAKRGQAKIEKDGPGEGAETGGRMERTEEDGKTKTKGREG